MSNDWLDTTNEKWHEYRLQHIGASEISAILGESDYRSAHDLFLEKTGQKERFKGNFVTEKGQEAEPVIRALYGELIGEEVETPPSAEYKEWTMLTATPDGWFSGAPVEIKYLSGKKYEEVKRTGQVPKTYQAQVQQQMLVFGATEAVFVCVSQSVPVTDIASHDLVVLRVQRDEAYIEKIIREAKAFWNKVQAKKWIDDEVDHATLCSWLEQIETHKIAIEALDKQIEMLRDKVKAQVSDRIELDGWTVRWTERKGNVSYADIPELKSVDLDKYRKAPIRILDIRRK
jgi:putative phage-type endonuclease